MRNQNQIEVELSHARKVWGNISRAAREGFLALYSKYQFSVVSGDLLLLEERWYVTYTGLLSLAKKKRCSGISVQPVSRFCDAVTSRYAFKAIVYKSRSCRGFMGYGDADPSNTSPSVRGAEMRVAETRAVNRALRKAYGVGICSIEEIGSSDRTTGSRRPPRQPLDSSNHNDHSANVSGTRVRDRLCQIIRQHRLDAELVKSYAVDFCGTKSLREATREQVENFVVHLADWAAKDRNALLCQLNSYVQQKAGAA